VSLELVMNQFADGPKPLGTRLWRPGDLKLPSLDELLDQPVATPTRDHLIGPLQVTTGFGIARVGEGVLGGSSTN
jgi:hypothetical protein